jgi:RNA polymerase sigma factor (sigma-70 family)
MTAADDLALLSRFHRQHDAEAFAEIVRRYSGWVYGVSLRACHDRHLAEDATQECFLELARQAHRVRTSLASWLHVVARRIATRLRPRASSPLVEETVAAVRDGAPDLLARVDEALAALPADQRDVLLARFGDGLDQQAIAARFGLNQSTVSRRLERAFTDLRARLGGDDHRAIASIAALAVAPDAGLEVKLGKIAMAAPAAAATGSVATIAAAVGVLAVCGALTVAWRATAGAPSVPATAPSGSTAVGTPNGASARAVPPLVAAPPVADAPPRAVDDDARWVRLPLFSGHDVSRWWVEPGHDHLRIVDGELVVHNPDARARRCTRRSAACRGTIIGSRARSASTAARSSSKAGSPRTCNGARTTP